MRETDNLDTSIQPDYEDMEKQRVLEEYERRERNSSKTRNPMRHLTPKKKKRK